MKPESQQRLPDSTRPTPSGQLRPYPAMKDSDPVWLGEVPAHWQVQRIKRLARLNPSKAEAAALHGRSTTVTMLPMEHVGTDGHINSAITIPISAAWNGFTYFRRGDVIVAKITPCFENGKGACLDSLPTEIGFGSTEFHVLRAGPAVSLAYLYRVTTLPEFRHLGTDAMTGAAGQQRVSESFVATFRVPLPPMGEQAAIVRFLDHADRKIRRAIRAKQKLVKLLEQEKQAIIHRAVTRGLDPNVRLKPSGVEWLGEVPEHWEVCQIGHFANIGNGSTPSRGNSAYWSDGSYPWLNSSKVNAGTITASDQFVTDTALRECHLPRVLPGSVLVAITGQGKTRGTAAVLAIEATINQHIAFITPRKCEKTATSDFVKAFLVAAYSELRRLSGDSGSTKGALTCEDIRHFRVVLPPLEEQEQIVRWTQNANSETEAALRLASREIDLLHEYRTRLIADVVTGKLDVREAAAQLPEEVESDEPDTDEEAPEVEGNNEAESEAAFNKVEAEDVA